MTTKDLQTEFMKEIEGKEIRKFCMKHESCRYKNKGKGSYSKKDIEQTLSKLNNKYISVEEQDEKLKGYRRVVARVMVEHEKEVKRLKEEIIGRKNTSKKYLRNIENKRKQLSQSISIKEHKKEIDFWKKRAIPMGISI